MTCATPAVEVLAATRARSPSLPHPAAGAVADALDQRLLTAIQDGLPLVSRPYLVVGDQLGMAEEEVLRRLRRLLDRGVIKRLGVIVRHRELGYRANAMVVWNVPDEIVDVVGHRLASCAAVRLCYQRPRRLPDWPYNLFCMIHGRDRAVVREYVEGLTERFQLQDIEHDVLFSSRRFKQRGARYTTATRRTG